MSHNRIPPEKPGEFPAGSPPPSEKINLTTRIEWTARELCTELERHVDPQKTYVCVTPGRDAVIRMKGDKLLTTARAVAEVTDQEPDVHNITVASRTNLATIVVDGIAHTLDAMAQNVSLSDPLRIKKWIANLEDPVPAGMEPFWDGSERIIDI
jgi:hypothetical protein